jgi:HPt (histidine-containing phosphotransfer) domain-containing protein
MFTYGGSKSHERQRPVPVNETLICTAVYEQLRQAMAADAAGFVALYRDYLADARQSLHVIKESIEGGRADLVRSNAHYLRSSSLVLGASEVARCAGRLEEAAIAFDLKQFDALQEELQTALNRVQAELSERLGNDVFPASQTAA